MAQTKATWQERESSLLVGAPLVLLPAIAILPTLAFLIVSPRFAHARLLGCVLIPLYGAAEVYGLGRIAFCMRKQFDVISFFAAGVLFVLVVVMTFTGVMMVGLVFRG